MFGLSFGEILVVVIIGIVVLGPKRLPTMMRTAGQWVSKLRHLSGDLRAQSGIDDLIKQEGLENEIRELRSLSRINVIDTLITPAAAAGAAGAAAAASTPRATVTQPRAEAPKPPKAQPSRQREYPVIGCDAYGALADDVAPKESAVNELLAKNSAPADVIAQAHPALAAGEPAPEAPESPAAAAKENA